MILTANFQNFCGFSKFVFCIAARNPLSARGLPTAGSEEVLLTANQTCPFQKYIPSGTRNS